MTKRKRLTVKQYQKIFGFNCRYWRQRLALTQSKAAEKLGMSNVNLCNLELGKTKPSFDTIVAIANTYGVPVSDLFWNTEAD